VIVPGIAGQGKIYPDQQHTSWVHPQCILFMNHLLVFFNVHRPHIHWEDQNGEAIESRGGIRDRGNILTHLRKVHILIAESTH
jgi:hypothetical protein